jgi:7-cyano-7-deazaguanine synthase in queuosine biosynthesis
MGTLDAGHCRQGSRRVSRMTKGQVIERLCALSTKVGSEVFKDQNAHDCFCGSVTGDPSGFRFEDCVMEFIEEAVNKAIDERA